MNRLWGGMLLSTPVTGTRESYAKPYSESNFVHPAYSVGSENSRSEGPPLGVVVPKVRRTPLEDPFGDSLSEGVLWDAFRVSRSAFASTYHAVRAAQSSNRVGATPDSFDCRLISTL